jgi:hypothetical protein
MGIDSTHARQIRCGMGRPSPSLALMARNTEANGETSVMTRTE